MESGTSYFNYYAAIETALSVIRGRKKQGERALFMVTSKP